MVVGLTLRVGRAVTGIVDILRDLIESGQSILLMGRPGLGKTTLLREMARVLADEIGKRVVIVDTSNEIAGDGDVPHPAIGRARRMQVAKVEQQHDVMIEAVENHMPEVVVIDEIGRIEEAQAARTIAERGVQLVATVHGNTLDNLLANPSMSDLIGGIQAVTLSDEEARRRGTQKTVLERKAPPTFDVVVEMVERDRITVRRPVAEVVDQLLRGYEAPPETRFRDENGEVVVEQAAAPTPKAPTAKNGAREHEWDNRNDARGGKSGRANTRNTRSGGRGESRGTMNAFDKRAGRTSKQKSARDTSFGDDIDLPIPPGVRRYTLGSLRSDDAAMMAIGDAAPASDGEPIEYSNAFPARPDDAENDVEAETFDGEESRDDEQNDEEDEEEAGVPTLRGDVPADISRVRRLYPFGVSRSRLGRAIKHLGLPIVVAKTWKDADAVAVLVGPDGLSMESSLLKEARELGLPLIGMEGNTYAEILARLDRLYAAQVGEGAVSTRDLALREAHDAAQRVLKDAQPAELRPQPKQLRRAQHQLAERFHLRSYSVGRDPNRRVKFLPDLHGR
jgi:nucleoside-triphosphatase THEP1